MRRGAEVFPNASRSGPADIVLKINGILYEFDVKTSWWEANPKTGEPRWQAQGCYLVTYPQWPIVVDPEISGYIVRWPTKKFSCGRGREGEPRCPEGLENFWNEITD